MIKGCFNCNYWRVPVDEDPCKACKRISEIWRFASQEGPALWEGSDTVRAFIVHGRIYPVTIKELAQEVPEEDLITLWRDMELWRPKP